uniref:Extradiol ring-cleavage dioxygenase class III enzyme subunit B domain-containing protein n=1 Tax=Globisporangium ultimum (strain ATCC 200006 / CBS 805.95 / DAOM BR144) TaxID=431595 RepID=K3WK33_GLOUD
MVIAFRHPVIALSHGPGPLWLLKNDGSRSQHSESEAAHNLRTVFDRIYPSNEKKQLPKRILLISAHWESSSAGFEISKAANPGMIYDYRGFPPESYKVVYAAKGDPEFAAHVHELLEQNKIETKLVE